MYKEKEQRVDFFELFIYFLFLGWVFDMFQFYDSSDNLVAIEESYIDWDAECEDVISDIELEEYEWEEMV